jgi:dephospho-CoA kinase
VSGKIEKGIKIGLTGPLASGKGEVAGWLKTQGFDYISLSDMVREALRKEEIEETRENLMMIGNGLREKEGAGVLGKRVKEKILSFDEKKNWVIDGIRNPAEIEELREMKNFFLLAIVAPKNILIERVKNRKRGSDPMSEEEIEKKLNREWGIGEPPEGQQVGACIGESDFFYLNEKSLDELFLFMDNLLKTIKNNI